ncbi:MAG: SRPBCC domain-containing protein [Microthrixaceae bacterium]
MTVTEIRKDPEALTMTVTAEFDHPVDRVWQLWSDPRKLERWWGPPEFPATFERHELEPGGTVTYFMTGPEGEQYHGWWAVVAVDAPRRLEVRDGFADDQGRPNEDMPVTVMLVELSERDGGTSVRITSTFPSVEAMEQLVAMGMDEGLMAAMGQMDGLLAEAAA